MHVKAVRTVGVYERYFIRTSEIRFVVLLIIVIDPRFWGLNSPFHNIYTEQITCHSSHSAPTAAAN